MVDEVLSTVVASINVSAKGPPRLFEATGEALQPLPIQMATALMMKLVQVRVSVRVCAMIAALDGRARGSTALACPQPDTARCCCCCSMPGVCGAARHGR